MFGNYFYHERIRKSVALFGKMFNDIYVLRKDSSGQVISQVKAPLAYASKAKFLERIKSQPDLINDTAIAVKLPRMSFEIVTIQYDPQRQLQKTNNLNRGSSSIYNHNKIYTFVPYTINFQLNIYTKTQDDALQIVEQIFPYFSPQYTLTIKPFATHPEIVEDVPITIQGTSFTDDYEGSVEQRRTIIYTLDFEMRTNFYGPMGTQSIIRQADAVIFDMNSGIADSDQRIQTIRIEPNPINISADSDYGFTETYYGALDSA
jgi:hypothetical protein